MIDRAGEAPAGDEQARRRAAAERHFADETVHLPGGDSAAREMDGVAGAIAPRRRARHRDRHLSVEKIDRLVAVIMPGEPASAAFPQYRRSRRGRRNRLE